MNCRIRLWTAKNEPSELWPACLPLTAFAPLPGTSKTQCALVQARGLLGRAHEDVLEDAALEEPELHFFPIGIPFSQTRYLAGCIKGIEGIRVTCVCRRVCRCGSMPGGGG